MTWGDELENRLQDRFSKSHAVYDIDKLKWINAQHIKNLSDGEYLEKASRFIEKDSFFHSQSGEWQQSFLNLYRDKIQLFPELNDKIKDITSTTVEVTDDLKDILSWETTPQIKEYIATQLESVSGDTVSSELFSEWMDYCKKELKIKGKPLSQLKTSTCPRPGSSASHSSPALGQPC